MTDVAIIIVSTNEAKWLEPALTTVFAHAGDAQARRRRRRQRVDRRDARARRVEVPGRARGRLPEQGLRPRQQPRRGDVHARYVLFLNPDTEIVDGTFGELAAALDARPDVGMAGVRQLTGDGTLWPTIRHFPSVRRALGEAFGSERWPTRRSRWAGERELDLSVYETEVECDWTSGSFMFCRREALLSAGLLDERFFIYSEEPDLCLRMKRAAGRSVTCRR